jgi:hypothetical protein
MNSKNEVTAATPQVPKSPSTTTTTTTTTFSGKNVSSNQKVGREKNT